MNFLLALLFIILYAFIDYFGYNTVGKWAVYVPIFKWKIQIYRLLQNVFQFGVLTPFLYFYVNPVVAFIFNLLWWTWNADLVYYAICEVFNGFHLTGFPGRGSFKNDVLGNQVTWASWTPYGLIRGAKTMPISYSILLVQSFLGTLISVVLGVK
jgi:hypothetical protein